MTSFDFGEVLTTGASGMIGAYVDFGERPTLAELDITDEAAVLRYVQERRPCAILHLAGATDMERTEREPSYAYELNVGGTYNIAQAARAVGATVVYASTSRVFKGDKPTPYTEEDIPEPQTHYGKTKHIGECVVAALAPRSIIARTSWVFGGGPERDNKFYGNILRQLNESDEIAALDDVHGSPTYGKDYIAAIKTLLEKGESGTFHIANTGDATRYDLAKALAAEVKPNATVRAVDRGHFASGGSLPANEAIVSKHFQLRPWKDALSEYVSREWASLSTTIRV